MGDLTDRMNEKMDADLAQGYGRPVPPRVGVRVSEAELQAAAARRGAEVVRNQHVYAPNQPDARQSMDPNMKPSRFRPVYRPLSQEEKQLHDAIKAKAEELERLIEQTPQGRYQSLAMTALEESVIWAVKGLTA